MSEPTTANPIPENKLGSREFEETMRTFETIISKGAKREAREFWKMGAYYCDGHINEHFKGFLKGIAYARSLANF